MKKNKAIKTLLIVMFIVLSQMVVASMQDLNANRLENDIEYYSNIGNKTKNPNADIINIYTPVIDIDFCTNSISTESLVGFSVGDRILIIQMKGTEINLTNSSSFGNISNYNSAGNYEFGTISEIAGNTAILENQILNEYDVISYVQLIKVAVYDDLTITNTITCKEWDEGTGGVCVIESSGTILLNADINVDGAGFRGGEVQNQYSPYGNNNYYYSLTQSKGARKGEGVYNNTSPIYECGKGSNANGGGGGNGHNRGGGGGGNFSNGGIGGNKQGDSSNGKGIGGKPLLYSNSENKIFMGGGGGAGDANNMVGTSGENGGGIVIIKANNISGNNHYISANGNNVEGISEMDGSGGGGAGGTIVLDVPSSNISGLNIEIKGGNGGNNNPPANNTHSPGGGGSGGLIWTSDNLPASTSIFISGGEAGLIINPNSPYYNTSYGATNGEDGGLLSGLQLNESINPFSPLQVFLGNDTTICLNDIYLIGPGPGYSEYLWQDGTTDSTFEVNTSGLYWVEVTNEFGCSAIDSINIELLPSPEIDLGNDTLICIGSNLVLDAGSGYQSYLWNTGSLDSTITIDTTGIYWVEVTNEFGCTTIDSIYVGLAPNAIEDLNIGNDTIFCFGQQFIINAGSGYTSYEWQDGSTDSLFIADTTGIYYVHVSNPCGEAWDTIKLSLFPITKIDLGNDSSVCLSDGFVLLDPGMGFNSYQWQDGSSNPFYYANQSGEYWVGIIDDNGCAVHDTISLDFIDPDPGLGPDTSICSGNFITFSAQEGFSEYLWQDGSDGYSIVTGTEGTYWCEVTDSLGCTGADSVLLGLLYPPNISLGDDTSICLGDSMLLSYLPVDSNFTYLWQDGTNGPGITIGSEGYYWVQATNTCGSGFDSVYVSIMPLPAVFLGGDMVIGIRDEVVLDAGEGFMDYLWNNGSGYQTITVSDSGNYWVRVSDGSCFNSDTVHIEEVSCDLLVPIVFTPNWDNFNDYFQVVASDDIIGFDLVVVNRWGEKMWETNDVNGKWDGRKNGANSPTGTYFWICEYKCLLSNKTYTLKGSVTLLK